MENISNFLKETSDRAFFTINRLYLERQYPDVKEAKRQVREIEIQARQTASKIAWDLREIDGQGNPKSSNRLEPKDILDYLKIAYTVATTQVKLIIENENVREMSMFDREISSWSNNTSVFINPSFSYICASEEFSLKEAIQVARKANFQSRAWREVTSSAKDTEVVIRGLKEAGKAMEGRVFKKPTISPDKITVLPALRLGKRINQPEVTLAQIQNHLLQTVQRHTSLLDTSNHI